MRVEARGAEAKKPFAKINWQSLPLRVKQHLIEQLKERKITQGNLEN